MAKTFQIYYTSDTHGHIFPVNYAANCPEKSGLLNMAVQIEKDGNTLVLDGGDSLQGTPLTQYYLENQEQWPVHPVAAAFNAMGLDYFTLGNHDFNFGYEALRDYLRAMNGVCLCANVEDLGGELPIRPWTVHTLANGLRVGITGVVTDFVNVWEQPQNLERIRITDAFQAARATCAALREQCDVSVTCGCASTTEVSRRSWKQVECSRTAGRMLLAKLLGNWTLTFSSPATNTWRWKG